MSNNKQNLHSITQQEETIMSNKNNPGVVVLQNGQTMSITDYIKGAPEQEAREIRPWQSFGQGEPTGKQVGSQMISIRPSAPIAGCSARTSGEA